MSKHPFETYWAPVLTGFGISLFFFGFTESLSKSFSVACWTLSAVLLIGAAYIAYKNHKQRPSMKTRGGAGGAALSQGDYSEAIGGNGGKGNGGFGGNGGNAVAQGKGSKAKGGNGGSG